MKASVAEKHMENGETKLNEADLDMAAFYFEEAGRRFAEDGNKASAIVAYEKVLYCYETDGKSERVDEIRGIISGLKNA